MVSGAKKLKQSLVVKALFCSQFFIFTRIITTSSEEITLIILQLNIIQLISDYLSLTNSWLCKSNCSKSDHFIF